MQNKTKTTKTNLNYWATCHLAAYGSLVTQRRAEPIVIRAADDRQAQRKPVSTVLHKDIMFQGDSHMVI